MSQPMCQGMGAVAACLCAQANVGVGVPFRADFAAASWSSATHHCACEAYHIEPEGPALEGWGCMASCSLHARSDTACEQLLSPWGIMAWSATPRSPRLEPWGDVTQRTA